MKRYGIFFIILALIFSGTGTSFAAENRAFSSPPDPVAISDDYFSTTQYSFNNTGSYMRYVDNSFVRTKSMAGIDLDVPAGWSKYKNDNLKTLHHPVIVAVIDSGIDYRHPDLAENIWVNEGEIPDNGKDDDGNGYIDDIYGWDFYNDDNTICHYSQAADGTLAASPDDSDEHGTHVAGIIAAVRNNGIGIAGLASIGDVKIMCLKIHGGSSRKGKLSDAIKAIKYAERMGASVCNISWGTYTYSPALASAIKHSRMLFVCAAGNDGTDNDERPIYPACLPYDNVISVGFVNADGTLTYNSNYGADSVDVVVPSADIISTSVGSYSSMGGSSMAAPHISAIAALIWSYKENISAASVRKAICSSIKEIEDLEPLIKYPGIPSLSTALSKAGKIKEDTVPPKFSLNIGYDTNGIRIKVKASDKKGSGISTVNYLPGNHTAEDFKNGTEGCAIEDDSAYLSKAGIYTFYIVDKAGNSTLKTLPILDDIIRPTISDAKMTVDNDLSSILISANVKDLHSGIKTVKYLRGKHKVSDFKSASSGTRIDPADDGSISFSVTEQGPYTIYVSDNRGNSTVITVMAYLRPSLAEKATATQQLLNIGSR